MFHMFRCLQSARLSTVILGGVLAVLCAAPVAAVPSLECALGDSLDSATVGSQSKSLQVEQAGYLLVEVQGGADGAAWFDVSQGCGKASTARVVEHGFDHGVLWVEPGAVELRYGTVDPAASHKLSLSTRWMNDHFGNKDGDEGDDTETGTAEIVPIQDFGGCPWPDKDGEEGDDTETGTAEIVPVQGFGGCPWPDKDGDEGDDTETGTAEIVPAPFQGGEDHWPGCLNGVEPFDDFALCASPLMVGNPVTGYLEAKRFGDRDYYHLTLEQTGRVRMSLQGQTELRATLLLSDGRPLRQLSTGPMESKGLGALEVLLPAGEYLVRVEGTDNAVGAYRLDLQ